MVMWLYLNESHSETDTQDEPDVAEEPALHTGRTTLNKTRRLMHQHRRTNERKTQFGECKLLRITENTVYHIIYGPVGCLSLTESTVGKVASGERDVLAGTGEEQVGAIFDDHVTVPVSLTAPATALHLQKDRTTDFNSEDLQCGKWRKKKNRQGRSQRDCQYKHKNNCFSKSVRFSRQEWTRLVRYYGFSQCWVWKKKS